MSNTTNKKFAQVVRQYITTGNVEVGFNADTFVTTLNGVDFTVAETKQLTSEFRNDPAFIRIMKIVNASPVAAEARKVAREMNALAEKLERDTEMDNLLSTLDGDIEGDDGDGEDFVDFQDDIENMEEGDTIEIDIPGIGKIVLRKVDADVHDNELQEMRDSDEWKEITADDLTPEMKEELNGVFRQMFGKDLSFGEYAEDLQNVKADDSLVDALNIALGGTDVLDVVKSKALQTMRNVLIQIAISGEDFDGDELDELEYIIDEVLNDVYESTKGRLPNNTDFQTAFDKVIAKLVD